MKSMHSDRMCVCERGFQKQTWKKRDPRARREEKKSKHYVIWLYASFSVDQNEVNVRCECGCGRTSGRMCVYFV